MSTEVEEDASIPNIDLPKYYPTHERIINTLSSYKYEDTIKELEDLKKDLVQTSQDYADAVLEGLTDRDEVAEARRQLLDRDESLQSSLDALDEIHKLERQQRHVNRAVIKTKAKIHQRYKEEEKLTVDTLAIYQKPKKNIPLSSVELLDKFSQDPMERTDEDIEEERFHTRDKVAIYIDPHAVIKERSGEEDDLEVSGGRVELRCPLSQQIMTLPVMTKNCKHTFDRGSLEQYLSESHTTAQRAKCPVCGSQMGGVQPDDVMTARLTAYSRIQAA